MMFLQQLGVFVKQQLNTKANKGTTLEEYGITDAINVSEKGAANGIASLDSGGKVPANQLPSFVDDVLEYPTFTSFPITGESSKIYTAIDTNKIYRWSGSAYIEISPTAGNADSATKFATARKINGVDFDGTKDITINAVDSTARIASSEKGAANGVASLGADGKVPSSQLPSVVAGLTDAGHSFSDNGYMKLSNGLILQWSTWTDNGGWTTRSFPIAFPNACFGVWFTPKHPSGDAVAGGIVTISGAAYNNAGFREGFSNGNGWTVKMFAIGY